MKRLIRVMSTSTAAVLLAGSATVGIVSADEENFNVNTQTAVNAAELNQAAAAVSGNATAIDDSYAESGYAEAIALSAQVQTNVQIAANQLAVDGTGHPESDGDVLSDNSNAQDSANAAGGDQAAAAVSGEAYAEDSSEGYTGFSEAAANAQQIQTNVQAGINQARVDLGGLFGGMNVDDDEDGEE